MSEPSLTPRDRAVLMALMAVGEEIANPMLKQQVGIELDKPCRTRLNESKLVTSRQGPRGTFLHELTDKGWAWCRAEMGQTAPTATRDTGIRVLYAVMASLGRYLEQSSVPLSELFRPRSAEPEVLPEASLEATIRSIYERIADAPGEWVSLTEVRRHLSGIPKTEVDRALLHLSREPDVNVEPNVDQRRMTQEDRDAAVRIGGKDKHLIAVGTA